MRGELERGNRGLDEAAKHHSAGVPSPPFADEDDDDDGDGADHRAVE